MYYMLVRFSINLWVCIPGIRNPKNPSAERRMTLKFYSDYLGNWVNQVPFKGQQADLKLDCHLVS